MGRRYLAGKQITIETALDLLSSGTQRQRMAAALELALMRPEQALFEVRARGNWQRRSLEPRRS